MKKLYIAFAAMMSMGLASCDMDLYPKDAIPSDKYMKTFQDFAQSRKGLYVNFRGLCTGQNLVTTDIQCDDFQAAAGFSNNFGDIYRWDFQPSGGYFSGIFSSYYGIIKNCNYYLENYKKFVNGEVKEMADVTDQEKKALDAFAGDAYFFRAYCYFMLSNYFCKPYTQVADPEKEMGMPLQLSYVSDPAASSKYPGRSSLKATYLQIEQDLKMAEKLVNEKAAGTATVHYVSKNLVSALKSRVALYKGDYTTAATAATKLINSKKYPLYNLEGETFPYIDMWIHDTTQESIWQVFQNKDEKGGTTGTYFLGQYEEGKTLSDQKMDFLPSGALIKAYDQVNDIRFYAFFNPTMAEDGKIAIKTSTGAAGSVFLFQKYSGNPDLYTSAADKYSNMNSPFRIAEQYLIAAEAYAKSGDEVNANKYLNLLRKARISEWSDQTYSGTDLMKEIQLENRREFVGENHRFFDLRRWGLGFDRASDAQDPSLVHLSGSPMTTGMVKDASDFRFVWPFPQNEMDMSPAMKGQQNPGY